MKSIFEFDSAFVQALAAAFELHGARLGGCCTLFGRGDLLVAGAAALLGVGEPALELLGLGTHLVDLELEGIAFHAFEGTVDAAADALELGSEPAPPSRAMAAEASLRSAT